MQSFTVADVGSSARSREGVPALTFRHVDVFADAPYRGNGLIVVFCPTLDYRAEQLRTLTEEMRQFETIFVRATSAPPDVAARIFTVEEELPFAGHPVIGAAAALHERIASEAASVQWQFTIHGRQVPVVSERDDAFFTARMDQGEPEFVISAVDERREQFAAALNLTAADLRPFPLQVVSTGLPYLIVPVTGEGLSRARIVTDSLDARLAEVGARFVYVLDTDAREGRTWDNAGAVEDIATGSAAGPAAAYLHRHKIAGSNERVNLTQGGFVGRPSSITVARATDGHLWVGGPVRPVASGRLDTLPSIRANGSQQT